MDEASAGSIQYTQVNAKDATKLDTIQVKLKSAKGAILDTTKTVQVRIASTSQKSYVLVEKILDKTTYWNLIWLVFIQILYVTMVYGPIAAFLVELFPTKIRYTSMSLPYHIGNGVFGGLVPFLGTLIVEFTKTADNPSGDPLAGLWYPIGVASICLFIGVIYLTNKVDKEVMD
jgi:MHS family proline/betaine transporter-like MFS transporter